MELQQELILFGEKYIRTGDIYKDESGNSHTSWEAAILFPHRYNELKWKLIEKHVIQKIIPFVRTIHFVESTLLITRQDKNLEFVIENWNTGTISSYTRPIY